MSVSIPPRPAVPVMGQDGVNKDNYEAKMIDYQDAAAQRRLLIQTLQQDQTEEQATKTNMSKTRHDAMMAIVGNFKS